MKKRIIPLLSIVLLSLLVGVFFFESSTINTKKLGKNFSIDAIYDNSTNLVTITFNDKSQKTISATLEILGMEKSFQKKYTQSNFIEQVKFDGKPQYGWQIHPITILVENSEFGKISIKTEIHSLDEPKPQVIFSPA